MDAQILKDKLLIIKDKVKYNKKHFLELREYIDITKIAEQIDDSR